MIARQHKGQCKSGQYASFSWVVTGVFAGLWSSGLLWLLFHHFLQQQTDFGPRPHAMEYWSRAAHGLFCFAMLWLLGYLWAVHVRGACKFKHNFISGLVLMGLIAWLVMSGYFLYYAGIEWVRDGASLSHWVIGAILPLIYGIHLSNKSKSHA